MKPLPAIFAFIGLTAVMMAVFGCVQQPTGQLLDVKIGDPNAKPPKYVELKDGLKGEPALRIALAKIKQHQGVCEIYFLRHDGEQPDRDYCNHIDVHLKTNRVIKSKVASHAHDDSATNDPNLMYRISSSEPSDITGVLDLLK